MVPAPVKATLAAGDCANAPVVPAPVISLSLRKALTVLDKRSLLAELLMLIQNDSAAQRTLEQRLLVRGRDVVRYHVDSDSEDNANSEIDNEDVKESESDNERARDSKRRPIGTGDDDVTGRFAVCLHCNTQFDVTMNNRGDCRWHSGKKRVYFESDVWDDHDHRPYEDFEDDADFAEGFIWTCCNEPGDNGGCKSTKHRAEVNVVIPGSPSVSVTGRKRKAEEEIPNLRAEAQKRD